MKWTLQTALAVVQADGFEAVNKIIRKPLGKGKSVETKGFTGLNKLSALDYLVNHCGYKF